MQKLLNYLKTCFIGTLSRKHYIIQILLCTLIMVLPTLILSLLLRTQAVAELPPVFITIASIIVSILQITITLLALPYLLGLNIRRLREIMTSRSNAEIYTTFVVMVLLGIISPIFSTANFFILTFLRPNTDQTDIYKNYLQTPIANLTNFVLSLNKNVH